MPPQCALGIPTVWQTGKMFVLFNRHNVISRALMQDLMHMLWLTTLNVDWSACSLDGRRSQAFHVSKSDLKISQNDKVRTRNWLNLLGVY